jgi:hypothetical protein
VEIVRPVTTRRKCYGDALTAGVETRVHPIMPGLVRVHEGLGHPEACRPRVLRSFGPMSGPCSTTPIARGSARA